MVPGICHQSRGFDLFGGGPSIPVHALLGENGYHSGDQRELSGDNQFPGVTEDLLDAGPADSGAGGSQHHREQNRCHTFKPFMSEGVFLIRFLTG